MAEFSGRRQVTIERSGVLRGDWAVVEEPLEIRINGRSFAVTMRTPGQDRALAVGLLYSEGVLGSLQDLVRVEPLATPDRAERGSLPGDRLGVELTESAFDRWARHRVERELIATSACGVCGKPSLEDLWRQWPESDRLRQAVEWPRREVGAMVREMRRSQELFSETGGAHAAALFSSAGERLSTCEDIGRHNAVDKAIGSRLLESGLDLEGLVLVVSGRGGFEIVQKAIRARAAVIVSVGAASSLAIELALDSGLEMISFAARGGGNRHVRG